MTETNNVQPQVVQTQPKPTTETKPSAFKEMVRELAKKIVVIVLTTLLAAISGGVYTYNKEEDRKIDNARIEIQKQELNARMGRQVVCENGEVSK